MRLCCPGCNSEIPAEEINVQTGIAKCSPCSEIFRFADLLEDSAGSSHIKAAIRMPKNVSMEKGLGELLLVRRWISAAHIGLLFFCLFWDGFLVVWYYLAVTKNGPLVMFLFPLLHLAVGVALTYYVIAGLLNSTFIKVSHREISVRHAPVPWPGSSLTEVHKIDQLFCEEKASGSQRGTSRTYAVSVALKGRGRMKLVSDLTSPEQARFIEQEVEKFLKIKDRPVAGEMRPV